MTTNNEDYYARYNAPTTTTSPSQIQASRSAATVRSLEDLIESFPALSEQQDSPVLGRRPSLSPDDDLQHQQHGQSPLPFYSRPPTLPLRCSLLYVINVSHCVSRVSKVSASGVATGAGASDPNSNRCFRQQNSFRRFASRH